MGIAVDTIVGHVANPGGAFTPVVMNSGDSLAVRNFAASSKALLEGIIRGGATKGAVRVRSPLFHDDVIGIKHHTNQNPSVFLLPGAIGQPLRSGDTLIAEVTGGAAETDLVALRLWYDDLPGASARLYMPGDIEGVVANVHAFEVDVTNSATIGAWTDTAITANDNVLKADTDYALLGFTTDTLCSVVGVRGADFSNFRIGTSGTDQVDDTGAWFIDESNRTGRPHIPVFNSNNRSNTFVSTADVVASSAPIITLIVAQLAQKLS